jgi:hypothetical protein
MMNDFAPLFGTAALDVEKYAPEPWIEVATTMHRDRGGRLAWRLRIDGPGNEKEFVARLEQGSHIAPTVLGWQAGAIEHEGCGKRPLDDEPHPTARFDA